MDCEPSRGVKVEGDEYVCAPIDYALEIPCDGFWTFGETGCVVR
jgi:hypothetical protein